MITLLHNSILNNDNRYMKVTQRSKLKAVARYLISANYPEFETYIWHIRRRRILKDIFNKKSAPYMPSKTAVYMCAWRLLLQ